MKMKILSYLLLSLALLLSACLFDSDTEEEKESKSSSSTEVISSSSSAKVTSSSSSVTTNKSSSSGEVIKSSSSSEPKESSSSQWVDYPYYSSGIFCFTEGCEDNLSSSSSEESSSSSSEIIMSSSSQLDAIIEGGVMLDRRDNQTYKIITLNDKIWMAQNIGYETPSGSFCYEDKETNCDDYGRLYIHDAALLACPGGWHLATRSEFEAAMQEPTFIWNYNGRMSNNSYNFLDGMGFNWVSGTMDSGDKDHCDGSTDCRLIFVQKNPDSKNAADPALFFQKDYKTKGFSVRCVKN
jgi:uncharacterized protein (TIGR02145 family)